MHLCGLSQEDANLGLQWHAIAMYGPSFFKGRRIARFGVSRVVAVGLARTAAAAATGLMGVAVAHFWVTLVLLGISWNFGRAAILRRAQAQVAFARSEDKARAEREKSAGEDASVH
jgi:hypothetical protein